MDNPKIICRLELTEPETENLYAAIRTAIRAIGEDYKTIPTLEIIANKILQSAEEAPDGQYAKAGR